MDHADSADSKAGSHTRLVCRNPGPWWHAPLAQRLEAQNTSPFVCASGCRMDWSSRAPKQKRSIPLVCELGLLEWRFAKLVAEEARLCKRAREQGWMELGSRMFFLLMCKATA